MVGFFSLEMSAEQLATRILAEESGVSSDRIRRGDVSHEDFDRFVQASHHLQALPLFIDDTPALSVSALRTRARRLMRQQGLGLIVVDYLQLLRPSVQVRTPRKPGAGDLRHHPRAEGAGQGARCPGAGACRNCRARSSSARTSGRCWPICANRARSSRTPTSSCSSSARNTIYRGDSRCAEPMKPTTSTTTAMSAGRTAYNEVYGTGRDHHRQAAARADRHGQAAFRSRDHQVRQFHRSRLPARPGPDRRRGARSGLAAGERRRPSSPRPGPRRRGGEAVLALSSTSSPRRLGLRDRTRGVAPRSLSAISRC